MGFSRWAGAFLLGFKQQIKSEFQLKAGQSRVEKEYRVQKSGGRIQFLPAFCLLTSWPRQNVQA